MNDDNTIRLQKFLSERGHGSRRGVVALIEAGRVSVNGEPVRERGVRIVPGVDAVEVDGTVVAAEKPRPRTIAMYKPRGYICSRSSVQGKTVYDLLPPELHELRPVGRLDKDSEGLLLLSNDGDLIEQLTHPRFGHTKTYRVTVSGEVSERVLKKLQSRLVIDGYRINPVKVRVIREQNEKGRTVLEFVLKEGRNRQIRNMCELCRLPIYRLVRCKVSRFAAEGLRPGKWREVMVDEPGSMSQKLRQR